MRIRTVGITVLIVLAVSGGALLQIRSGSEVPVMVIAGRVIWSYSVEGEQVLALDGEWELQRDDGPWSHGTGRCRVTVELPSKGLYELFVTGAVSPARTTLPPSPPPGAPH